MSYQIKDDSSPESDTNTAIIRSYQNKFMDRLLLQRRTHQHTDITLKIGDKEFACHKVVLSAGCPYFDKMFSSCFKEANMDVIELKDTDPDLFEHLLDYIYTSKINITKDNVGTIVKVCDQYQMDELKAACDELMSENVMFSNCLSLHSFAKLYRMKKLLASSKDLILTNIQDILNVAESGEFQALQKCDLIHVISDNKLKIPYEDVAFAFVLKWIEANPGDRRQYFCEILQYLRLPHCTPEYLCDVVEKSEIMDCPEGQECIRLAKNFQICPAMQNTMVHSFCEPRESYRIENLIILAGGITENKTFNRKFWAMKNDTVWKDITEIPDQFTWLKACPHQNGIFVLGSQRDSFGDYKQSCLFYDPKVNEWKTYPVPQEIRTHFGLAAHQQFVYAIGGLDQDAHCMDSVNRFGLVGKEHRWTAVPSLHLPLCHPLATSYESKLFVASGDTGIEDEDNTHHSTSAFMYDPVMQIWSRRAEMPEVCQYGSMLTVNDAIYIVGGYTPICLRYDPKPDIWTILTPPQTPRGFASAVLWGDKIIIGGGKAVPTDKICINSMETYNLETDIWGHLSLEMPMGLFGHNFVRLASC